MRSTTVKVSTEFEGARGEVLSLSPRRASLAIPHDSAAEQFRQWFAFDLYGAPGTRVEARLENAGECTWSDAFGGDYKVYASEGSAWFRVESRLEKGALVLNHELRGERVRLAYYPPFPASRLGRLRRRARASGAAVRELAKTPGGRPVELFTFGREGAQLRDVWLIAQQHPGEAMAGWFIEGLVEALSEPEVLARRVLSLARVHVVPRMNPDGAAIGNHRTTPLGVDLNRAWNDESPPIEIAAVRTAMLDRGADLFIDVHGDERLPWVFTQRADRGSRRPALIDRHERAFEKALLGATPDFQTEHKYPYDSSGDANLSFSTNWVQEALGCLSMVLEMPFTDHRPRPNPRGFAPPRARRLGKSIFAGILAALESGARRA